MTATLTVEVGDEPGTGDHDGDPETEDQVLTVTVEFTAIFKPADGTADVPISVDNGSIATDAKKIDPLVTFTHSDADAVAGVIEVTARANNYTKSSVNISIIDRTADDVEGFRVTLVTPKSGAWAGAKKATSQFVRFQVTRLNKTQSYPWTTFQSVAVSLRDTSLADHSIMTLTADALADQNGNIVFDKEVEGQTNGASATLGDYKITYNEPDDKLIFEFKLPQVTVVLDADGTITGGNVRASLGQVTGEDTPNDDDDDHPRAGDTAKGQRVGVYAAVTFSDANGAVGTLNSRDDETKVFSNPATPGADQAVGDGNLIKIDLLPPGNIVADADLAITLNNKDARDAEAKIGDEIKATVSISGQTRFIRDGGMQIEFKTAKSGNANVASLKKDAFDQAEISAAAGDALRLSLKLTPGLIKTPALAAGTTRDGEEIAAKAKFEPDNVPVDVLVTTRDQAGNSSDPPVKKSFIADTRPPGIYVLYPADGDRFTGNNTDTDYDEFLNPLRIRVDEEEIDSLYVYADGAEKAEGVETIDDAAILLWTPDEGQNLDLSEVAARAGATSIGDTIIYNTDGLKYRKSNNKLAATAQGGTAVDLVVVAVDLVGNKTTVTLDNVIHDQLPPTISDWFPRNDLLEDDDNQINEATRHPVITLKEAVDSLSVTYDPSSGNDVVEEMGALAKGEHQVIITDPFVADRTYTLTIFARDLAGNTFETPASASADLKFNADFDNPEANIFTVRNFDPTAVDADGDLTYADAQSDSVVAGQAFHLRIKALDNSGTADDDDDDRPALDV